MCLLFPTSSSSSSKEEDIESSMSQDATNLCSNKTSMVRCRICFQSTDSLDFKQSKNIFCFRKKKKSGNEEDEFLTNVCACRGSIGSVHKSCLQKWLSISNSTSCDLCHSSFRHLLVQKPKTFSDFLASSSLTWNSCFWVDILSFVLLTPVTSVSLSLCLKGLLFYAKSIAEYISLITLMSLLVTTYVMWLLTCSYQHLKSFRTWKRLNFELELVNDGRQRSIIPTVSAECSNRTFQRQRLPGSFIRTSDTNEDVTMMMAPPSLNVDRPISRASSYLHHHSAYMINPLMLPPYSPSLLHL